MKVLEVVNHLTKLLADKTSKKVYVEQIGELTSDCIYVEIVSASRGLRSRNLEELTIKFDVKYYYSKNMQSNLPIYNMLDSINLAFDVFGIKRLKVLDRYIVLDNINQTIVDGIGHYLFDIKLLVEYGEEIEYELMQVLKTNIENKEVN